MMRDPYKVIVWGPGAVGTAGLRVLLKRPEFEVVGVLGFNPMKLGKDVGELIGQPLTGVKVTGDKELILNLAADCVLYTGAVPIDSDSMEHDLMRILESGKNVVTSASHHYPQFHGHAYMNRLEAACHKGNSCIHGTGENPGFWFERLALTLTGMCADVEYLKLTEYLDLGSGGSSAESLIAIGFNKTVEQASEPGPLSKMWEQYYFVETLSLASQALFNRPPDRVEQKTVFHPCDEKIVLSKSCADPMDLIIEKGRVGAMTHCFTAYLDGKARLTDEVKWYLKCENAPFEVKNEHYWLIELEGRPVSFRCEISAFASLVGPQLKHPVDPTPMSMYATVLPMIQAIPVVCAHKPGVVLSSVFTHSVPDFRLLER